MIKSMTGFGSTDLDLGTHHHRVEVKTVNSKFCDIKVKTPPDFYGLETRIKQYIRSRINRGHVDVFIGRESADSDTKRQLKVNWDLADAYYKTYESIQAKYGIKQGISLMMITNARDVLTLERVDSDLDTLWAGVEPVLSGLMDQVIEMREAEGSTLAVDLAGRCNTLKEWVSKIENLAPGVVESYKSRLEEKLKTLNDVEVDPARLAQEVCYFADRCDITEEIIRLRSHLQQFLHFLDDDKPVGRKLDFLIQELNRETNTIGSKSSSATISQMVVEVKAELEKIREQIQNVE